MKRFVTRALIVVASILGIVFAQVTPASAQAEDLAGNLGTLWTTVLETPAPENPFAQNFNPKFACFDLDADTVAPFAGGVHFSCTLVPNTNIFVVGFSVECSTFDADCGRGSPEGCNGTTPQALLDCARAGDLKAAPSITIDGESVTVTEVETPVTSPLNIVLPADNIFGEPAGTTGLSLAHGWVTQLAPLPPGNHRILIEDTSETPSFPKTETKIKVKPRH